MSFVQGLRDATVEYRAWKERRAQRVRMTPSSRAALVGAPDPDHVTAVTLNHPDGRARFHYDNGRVWVLAGIEQVEDGRPRCKSCGTHVAWWLMGEHKCPAWVDDAATGEQR